MGSGKSHGPDASVDEAAGAAVYGPPPPAVTATVASHGASSPSEHPVLAPTQTSPRAGRQHIAATLAALLLCAASVAANTTYCWGSGSGGRLGDGRGGTTSYSWPLPTAVVEGPEFASVTAGGWHTCALTAVGEAFCWGSGSLGRLGRAVDGQDQLKPVSVNSALSFSALEAGGYFTCGLSNGKAYCWGDGEEGQLGTGDNETSSAVPVAVAGGHTFSAITLGDNHACGLTPNGQAWCWGGGLFGQLGSEVTSAVAPVAVQGGLAFSSLTAGKQHTCGIVANNSTAFCWGNNADGQLGWNGSTSSNFPVPVEGGLRFTSIDAGGAFTCAIGVYESEERTYCWGRGVQLGSGSSDAWTVQRQPGLVAGQLKVKSISSGGEHACAVDTLALAWCWGAGSEGQLGNGKQGKTATYEFYSSNIPVPVAGDLPFYSISAGQEHTCGVSPKSAVAASPSPMLTPSPALSPLPANTSSPAPSPPVVPSTSSSSAPVGAIVGGVSAAAAVAAVLAYFALRPGKGWLRKSAHVQPDDAVKDSPAPTAPAIAITDSDWKYTEESNGQAQEALPLSYISSGPARTSRGTGAHRPFRPDNDPTLQYIASYIASRPRDSSGAATASTAHSGASNGSSEARALHPDAAMWLVQWSDLAVKDLVGRGSFGGVYRATWQETTVAVKVLFNQENVLHGGSLELPDAAMRELQAEAAVMIRMRHPNIVTFMGLCVVPPALITEYCARGSLYDCLRAGNSGPTSAGQLTWSRRLAMAVDAATGLVWLHGRGIVHRDVKSPNFLVDEHWRVKASDFNLSRLLDKGSTLSKTDDGPSNPLWLAPELLRGGHASAASDVFSFGVVLWELLTWRLPWTGSGLSAFQIAAKVVAGERLEIPARALLPGGDTATFAGLDGYCQVVRDCWAQDAADRPSMPLVVRRLRALQAGTEHLPASADA